MKTKHLIALILVLVGTNIFTFATTRYWTTQHVLTRAQERMDTALKKHGLYDQIYPADRPLSIDFIGAIRSAGGMYYWWNDAIGYWLAGVLFVLAGIGFAFHGPRRKNAG